jgi:hypothetical protein
MVEFNRNGYDPLQNLFQNLSASKGKNILKIPVLHP